MALKVIAAILGISLMLIYLAPVVLKLREIELTIVVVVGLGMMLVDQWQALKSKED
ncbi:MAG TPA: hypothetical protein VEC19_15365 [Usitatibacter sp.]|nr:hypothetical protein [Usitatibacter sp.]